MPLALAVPSSTRGLVVRISLDVPASLRLFSVFPLLLLPHPSLPCVQTDEGEPVVVTEALAPSVASVANLASLRARFGNAPAIANDRAPARHADAIDGGGGRQRSLRLTFDQYLVQHVDVAPSSLEGHLSPGAPEPRQPFYLNGWRPSLASRTLLKQLSPPPALAHIDQTVEIASALNDTLFRGLPKSDGRAPWFGAVDESLTKASRRRTEPRRTGDADLGRRREGGMGDERCSAACATMGGHV